MYSSCLLSLTPRGQSDAVLLKSARDNPAPQSERDLMLDSQSGGPLGRPPAVTSPIAAWDSGGWGTVYRGWLPAFTRTGQRDRRRFSQGCHQIGSALAPDKRSAPTNYYMRDRERMWGRVGALCLSSSQYDAVGFHGAEESHPDEDRHKAPTSAPPFPLSLQMGDEHFLLLPGLIGKNHQIAERLLFSFWSSKSINRHGWSSSFTRYYRRPSKTR